MEFDWLAADEAGHLAQMLSSGTGRVPETVLESEEDLFALHLFLDELPLTEPLSIPEGSFQALLAQPQRRGLYVYDAAGGRQRPKRGVQAGRCAPVSAYFGGPARTAERLGGTAARTVWRANTAGSGRNLDSGLSCSVSACRRCVGRPSPK